MNLKPINARVELPNPILIKPHWRKIRNIKKLRQNKNLDRNISSCEAMFISPRTKCSSRSYGPLIKAKTFHTRRQLQT